MGNRGGNHWLRPPAVESGPPPRLPWSRGRRAAATQELQSPPLYPSLVFKLPAPQQPRRPPRSLRSFRRSLAPTLAARRPGPGAEFRSRREGKEAGRRVGSGEGPGWAEGGLWGGRGDSGELWVRGETSWSVGELATQRSWMGVVRLEFEAGRVKGLRMGKDLETQGESPRKISQDPAAGRGREEGRLTRTGGGLGS